MIRRAAERQRQFERGEAGQEKIELRRVFGGEQPGEPAVVGVVDGQTRLHAGELFAGAEKGVERAPQLIGVGPVLGVVDRGERAARQRERSIERLGLGARSRRRCGYDLERRSEFEPQKCEARLDVVGLDNELHVQLLGRVVDRT